MEYTDLLGTVAVYEFILNQERFHLRAVKQALLFTR